MWKPKNVERALFTWGKWRQSIISQWLNPEKDLEEFTLKQLRGKVRQELRTLGLPTSTWLELYWICCTVSEYNLDDWNTFNNIVVPAWLLSRYERIMGFDNLYWLRNPISRVYPPEIWDEGDVDYMTRRVTGKQDIDERDRIYPWEEWPWIFLPSRYELYEFLNKLKGRPREKSRKPGNRPSYPDSLAVKCAVLNEKHDMTHVEIAIKFGLPITKPYDSRQSDIVRHLVDRGRKLITETTESL